MFWRLMGPRRLGRLADDADDDAINWHPARKRGSSIGSDAAVVAAVKTRILSFSGLRLL